MERVLLVELAACTVAALTLNACAGSQATSPAETFAPAATTQQFTRPAAANEAIRFLEKRIERDPEDYIALNKLADEYLQQMRETGDVTYLNLASRAAKKSLEVLPAQQNKGGLAVLILTEYSSHEFAAARDHAKQLIELEPNKGYPFQMLGDALIELGQYREAEAAYREMEELGGFQTITKVAIEQRLARFAALKGDQRGAQRHYSSALKLAGSMPVPSAETVAYCQWQLGETAFAAGDYETAEKRYRDSLRAFPDYLNGLTSMGRVRAALGDLPSAIDYYERAVRRQPDLTFVAALGDLYKAAGRPQDAQKQYDLVEQIGLLNEQSGVLYNRQLALFYADRNIKVEQAYELAAKEYETRRDVYGADALAWTALKAGKVAEAAAAIKDALRLGTQDARFFYHAGMIAHQANDRTAARKYLQRALALNPKFDLLQAEIAERTLKSL